MNSSATKVNVMRLYRNRKFWSLLAWSVIAVAGVTSLIKYLATHACDPVPISEVVVGKGRTIEITAESCWEISRSVYYEVKENGNVVTPRCVITFDSGNDEHRYAVLSAKGGSLVGVVDTTRTPHELVILHDFRSGESWPRLRDYEVSYDEAVRKKWRNLFDQLKSENPELKKPEYFEVEW
jgi:hypothetical protein